MTKTVYGLLKDGDIAYTRITAWTIEEIKEKAKKIFKEVWNVI